MQNLLFLVEMKYNFDLCVIRKNKLNEIISQNFIIHHKNRLKAQFLFISVGMTTMHIIFY